MPDISTLTQFLPGILVIFGWHIVNKQNNGREARKEYRALADSSKKLIQEIVRLSYKYHCDGDTNLSSEIKDSLDMLEIELERFPAKSFEAGSALFNSFVELTNSITEGDFESEKPRKLTRSDGQILRIARARNTIARIIEQQFSLNCK